MRIDFNLDVKLIDGEKLLEKYKKVLFLTMKDMEKEAIRLAPSDTGGLRSRIRLIPDLPGFSSYILTDGTNYGVHVEFGTSPHAVSAKHLFGWAQRNLGDKNLAYAIANKIKERGTDAHPFFRPALVRGQREFLPKNAKKVFAKD